MIVVVEDTADAIWCDIDWMAIENAETIGKTVSRVFGILYCTLLQHHTMEADGFSRVLDQVNKLWITNEVTNEDVLGQITLQSIHLTGILLFDCLNFSHPAECNLSGQKVACLLGIECLDFPLVSRHN